MWRAAGVASLLAPRRLQAHVAAVVAGVRSGAAMGAQEQGRQARTRLVAYVVAR